MDLLDEEPPLLPRRDLEPDLAQELLGRQVETPPLLQHFRRQVLDAVVEVRHRDAAVGIVQVGDDAGEHVDRIPGRAAE